MRRVYRKVSNRNSGQASFQRTTFYIAGRRQPYDLKMVLVRVGEHTPDKLIRSTYMLHGVGGIPCPSDRQPRLPAVQEGLNKLGVGTGRSDILETVEVELNSIS